MKNVIQILILTILTSCLKPENGNIVIEDDKPIKASILITEQIYQLLNEAYIPQINNVLPKKVTRKILMKYPLDRDLYAFILKKELIQYEPDSIYIQQQLMITDTTTRSLDSPSDWHNTRLIWELKELNDIELTDIETLNKFVLLNEHNPEQFYKQWDSEYDYGFVSITVPVFNKDSTLAIIAEEMTNFDWICGTGKSRVLKFQKVNNTWMVLNDE